MSGLLVIAGFIMLGRFAMMMCCALVVIGGGLVMLAALVRLRAHAAVLLLGALTAKRLLPKSDTRVNGWLYERHHHALVRGSFSREL
jgi:glycine/D-amino acid oxidase-like deaminating enzyme